MLALLEAWLFTVAFIAPGVVLALFAGRRRSRPDVALGLTAVPPLGFVFAGMFC